MLLERYFEVSQSRDIASFEKRLVDFAHEMEFPLISGALVVDRPARGRPVFLPFGNTPEAFVEISQNYEDSVRSPVNQLLKRLSVPILYDQDLYTAHGAGDIWEKHAPFGYKTGIAVALHLPGHRHFLLGVDRADPLPKEQRRLTRLMADLQLLAVHAQSAATALLDPADDEPADDELRLTEREQDVLRWMMEGKSAWAVGEILGVSQNTVNFHMRNIFRKLGVNTKNQTVLKALRLRLI